ADNRGEGDVGRVVVRDGWVRVGAGGGGLEQDRAVAVAHEGVAGDGQRVRGAVAVDPGAVAGKTRVGVVVLDQVVADRLARPGGADADLVIGDHVVDDLAAGRRGGQPDTRVGVVGSADGGEAVDGDVSRRYPDRR